MRRTKKWVLIGILVAVIVLITGLVGVIAVNAQTPSPSTTASSPQKNFADRVAKILGLDEAQVENAFIQAEKEIRDEALTNRLNSLVQQGKMTQDQADQYQQWWESRPDVPAPLGPQGHMEFRGGFKGMPGCGQRIPQISPSTTPSGS
jgi:hypothetical protein